MARNSIDRLASALAARFASGQSYRHTASAIDVGRLASAVASRIGGRAPAASQIDVGRLASAVADRLVAPVRNRSLASQVANRLASARTRPGAGFGRLSPSDFDRLASAVAGRLASAATQPGTAPSTPAQQNADGVKAGAGGQR